MAVKSTLYIPNSVLTGTACKGTSGPPIGHIDIGTSETAYLFRVALPGAGKHIRDVNFKIKHDGKVHLQGVVSGRQLANETSNTMYHLTLEQLSPPGPFTISFKLPGPVDPRFFLPTFRSDGIIEGVVMKYRAPGVPCDYQLNPRVS